MWSVTMVIHMHAHTWVGVVCCHGYTHMHALRAFIQDFESNSVGEVETRLREDSEFAQFVRYVRTCVCV